MRDKDKCLLPWRKLVLDIPKRVWGGGLGTVYEIWVRERINDPNNYVAGINCVVLNDEMKYRAQTNIEVLYQTTSLDSFDTELHLEALKIKIDAGLVKDGWELLGEEFAVLL